MLVSVNQNNYSVVALIYLQLIRYRCRENNDLIQKNYFRYIWGLSPEVGLVYKCLTEDSKKIGFRVGQKNQE